MSTFQFKISTFALAIALLVFCRATLQAQNSDLNITLQQNTANPVVTKNTVNYSVTVRNTGSQNANNVRVEVKFNLLFNSVQATSVQSGVTCTSVVTGTNKVVSCTASQMRPDARISFSINANAPSRAMQSTVTAQADPNNTVAEINERNNSATVTTTTIEIPDLDPDLTGSTLTANSASEVIYDVKVKNIDDGNASSVLVRSTLPQQVDFVRIENNQFTSCTPQGADINCLATTIAKDQTVRVRIVARLLALVADGAQISFAVNVDPSNAIRERNEQNNTAFVITTARAVADLQLTGTFVKTDALEAAGDLDHVIPGSPGKLITLNLQVRNNGPGQSPATSVAIRWPAGFQNNNTFDCPTGMFVRGTSCVEGQLSNCFDSCPVPSLAPGSVVNLAPFAVVLNGDPRQVVVAATVIPDPVREINSNNNVVAQTIQIP